MLLDYSKFEKIVKFRKNKKQKIIIIDKLLRKNYENIVYKSIKVSTKKPTKVFKKKGKIIKYEFNDKKNFHKTMKILYKELNSKTEKKSQTRKNQFTLEHKLTTVETYSMKYREE